MQIASADVRSFLEVGETMIGASFLGLEEKALKLCETRASLIAQNIANGATPNYKARDIDFQKALREAQGRHTLDTSNAGHISSTHQQDGATLLYRTPMQSSMDNNTVDDEIERKNFMQNALRFQASLGFSHAKMSQLLKAIRGE
ncbi:flagellar basal body rod protein FlgB [Legionella geestiana]|nr:flagellar basal body rod protein FlgB [Legionella geestiana]